MIKFITWYLTKMGWNYRIENEKYVYVNCPANSIGITPKDWVPTEQFIISNEGSARMGTTCPSTRLEIKSSSRNYGIGLWV